MPVAAVVVGNAAVTAALAAFDLATKGCGAAGLDGRHHLQLCEADVTCMLRTPVGAMTMEDVGEVERRTHGRFSRSDSCLPSAMRVSRADLSPPGSFLCSCRNAGIERGRVQLRMSKQHLDYPDINILFQEMRRKAMAQRVGRHSLPDAGPIGLLHGQRDGVVGSRSDRCGSVPETTSHVGV